MIAKVSAKKATEYYYEKDAIFDSKREGSNLNWNGAGATALKLDKEVNKDEFKQLLEGKTKDGLALRDLSKQTEGQSRDAYDLTFSAPKSVSHMALVMDDKRIIEAHKKAVSVAMNKVESLAETRVYVNGERVKERTGNLVYAQALHSTARATEGNVSDAHLHTHNVILNTTQGRDGKFRSLDAEEIMKNQSLINKTYKETLANELKNLDYGLRYDARGNFEIAGYSQDVLDNFSKRKVEIDKQVELMKQDEKFTGKTDKELRDYAQHNFKADKTEYTEKELRENWDKQHEMNGLTSKEELLKNVQAEAEYQQTKEKFSVEKVLEVASKNLMENESYVDKETLTKEALKVNQGDNKVEDIEKAINSIKKTGQTEAYDLKKITVDGEEFYTNKEMYDIQKENQQMILEMSKAGTKESIMSKEEAFSQIKAFEEREGFQLSQGQRDMFSLVLTTDKQLTATEGKAGGGKTTVAKGIRESVEATGQDARELLTGLGSTGKASSGLQDESGIQSNTAHSFLLKASKGNDVSESEIKKASKELNSKIQVASQKEIMEDIAFDKEKQSKTSSKEKTSDLKSKEVKENDSKVQSKEESLKVNSKENKTSSNENLKKEMKDGKKTSNVEQKEELTKEEKEKLRFKPKVKVALNTEKVVNHADKLKENEIKETSKTKGMSIALSKDYKKIKLGGGKLEITKLDDGTKRTKTTAFNKNTGNVETFTKTSLGTRKGEFGEHHNEQKMKLTDTYKDGAKREIEITKTNMFRKSSSKKDEKESEKKGEDVYKDTFSKKASDLLFKNDGFRYKQQSATNKFSEIEKKDASLFAGVLGKLKEEKEHVFDGKHHFKNKESSFKGFGIEFDSKIQEKKGNVGFEAFGKSRLNKEGRTLEFKKETNLKVFGKEINTSFLNKDYSKEELTFDNLKGKMNSFIDKFKDRLENEKNRDNSFVIVEKEFDRDGKFEKGSVTSTKEVEYKKESYTQVNRTEIEKDKATSTVSLEKDGQSVDVRKDLVIKKGLGEKDLNKVANEVKKDVREDSERKVSLDKKEKSSEKVVDKDKTFENVQKTEIAGKKMWILDEAGMLDARTFNSLLKEAKKQNASIHAVGDTKQIKAVGAGDTYSQIVKHAETAYITESKRQKDKDYKESVKMFEDGKEREAMSKFEKDGKLKEMSKNEIIDKMTDNIKENREILTTAKRRDTVKELNEKSREKIFGSKNFGVKAEINVAIDIQGDLKSKADTFEKGDTLGLKFMTESGKQRFSSYEVKEVNKDRNELILASDKKSDFVFDLRTESSQITTATRKETVNFAAGDKVIHTKNDKKELGVLNGEIGTIKSIDEKNKTFIAEMGSDKRDIEYNYGDKKGLDIAHGFSITANKSQGMTVDNVQSANFKEDRNMVNRNINYVELTRGRQEALTFTENKADMLDKIEKEQEKRSLADSNELKSEMSDFEKKLEAHKKEDSKSDAFKKDEKSESFNKEDFKTDKSDSIDKSEFKELKEESSKEANKESIKEDSKSESKEEGKSSEKTEKQEETLSR